jgi:hypothetical protein
MLWQHRHSHRHCDRPNGRTTKTRYGTASAAAAAAAEATEEEECDGCNGANPRHRLDDSLLHLADGILLRSIIATTAPRRGAAVESSYCDDVDACDRHRRVFIEQEDREGDDGSSVATEDDNNTNTEAGVYARDFLEVILRRLWEGRFGRRRMTMKMTDEQGRRARRRRRDAVDVRDTLRGRAIIVIVHGSPEAPIVSNDRGKGRRGRSVADETITDGAKTTTTTERGMRW